MGVMTNAETGVTHSKPGTLRDSRQPQTLREAGRSLSYGLTSDFWSPELRGNPFLSFPATRRAAICVAAPGT